MINSARVFCNLDCSKTRLNLEYSRPVFNKHAARMPSTELRLLSSVLAYLHSCRALDPTSFSKYVVS